MRYVAFIPPDFHGLSPYSHFLKFLWHLMFVEFLRKDWRSLSFLFINFYCNHVHILLFLKTAPKGKYWSIYNRVKEKQGMNTNSTKIAVIKQLSLVKNAGGNYQWMLNGFKILGSFVSKIAKLIFQPSGILMFVNFFHDMLFLKIQLCSVILKLLIHTTKFRAPDRSDLF